MTGRMEYRGCKVTTRMVRGRDGGRRVEVKIGGVFAWFDSEHNASEEKSLELTKAYIDDAIKRPGAYPVIDQARTPELGDEA